MESSEFSNDINPNNSEKNIFNFKRTIEKKELSFWMTLKEESINIKIKEVVENLNTHTSIYEKSFSYDEFQKMNKFFEILKNLNNIFNSLKKNFEQNKDKIYLDNKNVVIKLLFNIDILEEEIILDIPLKEKTSDDLMSNLKESVYFLNNEKNNMQQEINSLKKEISDIYRYMKEKSNQNKNKEKELKNYECVREIKNVNGKEKEFNTSDTPEDLEYVFAININILLYKEKIKIRMSEIQNNLKSSYLVYESDISLNDFRVIEDYYIKFGGIEILYNFLCELFEKNKDELIKDEKDEKITIKFKFPCGMKEEEISLDILNKELSLDNTLSNLKDSINYLNKENKKLKGELKEMNLKLKNNVDNLKNDVDNSKIQFQKEILEKVYPIGTYYWSQNNVSPEKLFGGKWEQIYGKFLFSSDSNHSVGSTGGEEKHILTINEMPSHNHGYDRFYCNTYHYNGTESNEYRLPCNSNYNTNWWQSSTTNSTGNGAAHNNMPPYITANCWKRIS